MKNKYGFNFDNSYLHLSEIFYSKTKLTKVEQPEIILFNEDLAEYLKLNIDEIKKCGAYIFSGNSKVDGGAYISQAYAGHQYGHFTKLGDGRAVLIGEHIADGKRYDIQLKGSGKTIFSRGGDGKATLGAMLREYIISEAMYHLGVPTTRSLCVTETGEYIFRNDYEKGAVLTRVSESHIRFGTFQFAYMFYGKESVKELADYTINRHYPNIQNTETDKYLIFFYEVLKSQAKLVAKWQSIGFIHGVMNTDNMSIVGESIDFGPCAFMNIYNPDTVFSSIDRYGRYAYKNQPSICKWNLCRLAETLAFLIDENVENAIAKIKPILDEFDKIFDETYLKLMCNKIGIFNPNNTDLKLIQQFLQILEDKKLDYTNSFIMLLENLEGIKNCDTDFSDWFKRWQSRINNQSEDISEIRNLMKMTNPSIIPRNNLVEKAISDFDFFVKFLQELKSPYSYNHSKDFDINDEQLKKPYKTFCGT